MSHTVTKFSAPGTPLSDRMVGELVAERPGRSRVFQSHGIEFCCQGSRTLQQACELKGVSVGSIVEELELEAAEKSSPEGNPAELSPPDLCDYIVATHHGYVSRELPRLHAMSARVAQVHGGHTPTLVEVHEVFYGLAEELQSHMRKEEQILFPAVAALGRGESIPGTLDAPIAAMMAEHDEAGSALVHLRGLTNGYQPPADACNTYRALFSGLAEFEEDLHKHIHLENSVLFPAARKMVEAATA